MSKEMEKDVKRLEIIAERFSKIGSLPEPIETNISEGYVKMRIPEGLEEI